MQTFIKKIYIGIITSILVLITTVATTFAWVGILTHASTGSFDINLKVENLQNEYFLTISNTGKPGTFVEDMKLIDIQKQIMDNRNIDYKSFVDENNETEIAMLFNDKATLAPVTTAINPVTNDVDTFFELNNLSFSNSALVESNNFFEFELYLSANSREGLESDILTNATIDASVALNKISDSLEGTLGDYNLINGNVFDKVPSYDKNKYPILNLLPNTFQIDSKSCARFSLSIYDPIDVNDEYTNQTPNKTIFYQGGSEIPTISDGVYSFGGILPEEYNFALQEANRLYSKNLKIDEDIKARKDLELVEENRFIWLADKEDSYLGVKNGIQTKMKIKVRFWFEGWDADCVSAIERKPVTLNLSFTSDIEEKKN